MSSDSIGPSAEGTWTLIAYDSRSGAVILQDQAVMPVRNSSNGQLSFGFEVFSAQGELAAQPDDVGRTALDLPAPVLPSRLVPLLNVCWEKANSLELQREPEIVLFGTDGRFGASFRSGACTNQGTFLFEAGAMHDRLLFQGDTSCSLDGRDPSGWRTEPTMDGPLLVLEGVSAQLPSEHQARTYRKLSSQPAPSTFVDQNFEMTVVGSYSQPPVVRQPWTVDISLRDPITAIHLTKLVVTAQVLEAANARLIEQGPPTTLLQTPLDVTVDRDGRHDESATITFPVAGPLIRFEIRIDAADAVSGTTVVDPIDYAFVIPVGS